MEKNSGKTKDLDEINSDVDELRQRGESFLIEILNMKKDLLDGSLKSWIEYYSRRIISFQTSIDLLIKLVSVSVGILSVLIIIKENEIILFREVIFIICALFIGFLFAVILILAINMYCLDSELKQKVKEYDSKKSATIDDFILSRKGLLEGDLSSVKSRIKRMKKNAKTL